MRLMPLLAMAACLLTAGMVLGQNPLQQKGDPYFMPVHRSGFQASAPPSSTGSNGAVQQTGFQEGANSQRTNAGTTGVQQSGFQALVPKTEDQKPVEVWEPGKVVAIVGGEAIFLGDMAFEIHQLLDRFMPGAPDWAKEQQRGELAKRLVQKYVDARLLYIDVKRNMPEEMDIKMVRDTLVEQFDTQVAPEMAKKVGLSGAIRLDGYLRARGSSLRQVREAWITDSIVKYFLPQQQSFEKEVTHDELIDYYRSHLSDYEIKAKARWEQMMVRFDKFNNRQEALAAIQEMGDEVYYGANLEAVARKRSHGFNASKGGQHDWTHKGSLALGEIDKAIFELPLNRLSEIIESKNGLHIVRVKERVDTGYVPFRDAQVEIKEKLKAEKRDAELQKHLTKIRQEIPTEILIEAVDPNGK